MGIWKERRVRKVKYLSGLRDEGLKMITTQFSDNFASHATKNVLTLLKYVLLQIKVNHRHNLYMFSHMFVFYAEGIIVLSICMDESLETTETVAACGAFMCSRIQFTFLDD